MAKRRFTKKPTNEIADNAVMQATIYSTSMRLMTSGGAVLRETYGWNEEDVAAWAMETIRRANPANAGDKFTADA